MREISREITTVLTGLSYLECPRWHDRIWFSDFYTHQVLSTREDGSDLGEADRAGQPSGLGWLPDGRLLVVSMRDPRCCAASRTARCRRTPTCRRTSAGIPTTWSSTAGPGVRRQLRLRPDGRRRSRPTVLHRVDPDGTVTQVADDLWFPNGSVITDDGVLLVVETFGNRVTAFDIERRRSLANRRDWAQFGELPTERDVGEAPRPARVAPDGCGLDAEGACGWPTRSAAG